MQLVKMCIKFSSFDFSGHTYRQLEGLPMGSPLSCVAACLFMEVLENEHYSKLISTDSVWYRYVDDCLIVTRKDTDLDTLLTKMNSVHERIQFTMEKENNSSLPFLDTVIVRTENIVKFNVYRKPTNKDDFIHYLSAHDERIKTGTLIGFYLRALRICSKEYIDEEINYIDRTFEKLKYPKGVLALSLRKARNILRRKETENLEARRKNNYIVVPNSTLARTLYRAALDRDCGGV